MSKPIENYPRCTISEALNTIEQWGVDGNTLDGDDVGRFRALADKIAPETIYADHEAMLATAPSQPEDAA